MHVLNVTEIPLPLKGQLFDDTAVHVLFHACIERDGNTSAPKGPAIWWYRGPRMAQWASYQIRKIAGCACAGNAGNVSPRRRFKRKPLVSDPGMHHGTCVTHVPWCMSGSLTCGDGGNVPGILGACAPAILRICQEAHTKRVYECINCLICFTIPLEMLRDSSELRVKFWRSCYLQLTVTTVAAYSLFIDWNSICRPLLPPLWTCDLRCRGMIRHTREMLHESLPAWSIRPYTTFIS